MATAASAAASRPAALVWFRQDLRLADHEPLFRAACQMQEQQVEQQQEEEEQPLLLPFACLDERELAPPERSQLGLPLLGPHRLRLLLEAWSSLRSSLRHHGSDLLWEQGRPEALVGHLVALAVAAGSNRLQLYHYMQPGGRSAGLEDAVAAAFSAAAEEHGLTSSVHRFWGHTLFHPDDLPYRLFSGDSDSGRSQAAASPEAAQQQQQQQQQHVPEPGSRINRQRHRFACLPPVMSDFRRPLQAHTAVRPPLPAPLPAGSSTCDGASDASAGTPVLPRLPASVVAAAADAGLLGPLPTQAQPVYAAAGPAAVAAQERWEELTGLRCAELAPAGSGQRDPRSAVPFTMEETQALHRLRHYLGTADSSSSSRGRGGSGGDGTDSSGGSVVVGGQGEQAAAQQAVAGQEQVAPIVGYQDSRMMAWGVDNSAKLSAFLSVGCLSPRVVHAEVMRLAAAEAQQAQQAQQQREEEQSEEQQQQQQQQQQQEREQAGQAAGVLGGWQEPQRGDTWQWLLMHLAVRDYFVFMALKEGDAAVERPEGIAGRPVEWRSDQQLFEKWARGQTGLPFVDACMRELATTGYMSNRGRQNVASLLSKGLHLDWRLGAEWFACLLGDHDESLNLLSWQYNSGIGTDPRGRVFHTISQGLRYDPEARLIASWVPELAGLAPDAMHQPWAAPPEALTAAGVCLGEAPVAAGEEQAAVAASSARVSWYPLPVVDPATQIAKGPRKKQPRGGGAPAAPS